MTSIAVDPRPPQQIFTGVYAEESLYASADGGVTWQHDGDGVAGQPAFAPLFDPQQADVLWAGTADGLYRGTVGDAQHGPNWQRVEGWPLVTQYLAYMPMQTGCCMPPLRSLLSGLLPATRLGSRSPHCRLK